MTKNKFSRILATSAALITFSASLPTFNAFAQSATRDPLSPLNPCVTIADPIKRLTCFDAAMVEARRIAERRQGLTPGAALESTATANAQFGLRRQTEARDHAPTNLDADGTDNDFGKSAIRINQERRNQGLDEKEQPSISSTIVSHAYDLYGKLRIELENGQVWQSTNSSEIKQISQNEPLNATIKKTLFGGYRLKIDGLTGSDTVKRIR